MALKKYAAGTAARPRPGFMRRIAASSELAELLRLRPTRQRDSFSAVGRLISILCVLTACRGAAMAVDGATSDAGADAHACTPVVPMTEAGTCPVLPRTSTVCDSTDTASGWCTASDCPVAGGCCAYGEHADETCFSVCGSCDTAAVTRAQACVSQGNCMTDSDCRGSLPHICQNCPLSTEGAASQGCAHWTCKAGLCEVAYCPSGLSCMAGRGCPSYYLPSFDRSCGAAADCVLIEHTKNCCLQIKTAVRVSDEARFEQAERACASIQDDYGCGCMGAETNEDGLSPGPGQSFEADCVAGTCEASITGRLQCGVTTCDAGQACCVSSDATGHCAYSCAASCPLNLNDAGALIACQG